MAIPDYETVMLPLLKFLRDREVHSKREAVEHLAGEFKQAGGQVYFLGISVLRW